MLSLLAACPARAVDPGKRISQYGHTAWRVQDGYFGGMPTWFTQTRDGYIWVGSEGGLYRFDGVRFVPFSSLFREKLPSSGIVSLFAARDGSLWIETGRGLSHWANQHLTTYKKDEGWIFGDLLEDGEGRIWFTYYRAGDKTQPLCEVIDAMEVRCYGSQDGVPPIGVGALIQDTLGNFWLGGSNAGANVEFTITPAWYQPYWFFALCATAALLLMWILYRMRLRQVANAMSVRLDERLSERTRLARDLHDTLLQTIQSSKYVADSALKRSTDASPMRDSMEQLATWLGRQRKAGQP